jgi:hypothetical protein
LSASRRRPRLALWTVCIASLVGAASLPATAPAQTSIDEARRTLDLAPDPLFRSPRLVGMGRLTLADDHRNRLTMWDFAGNPTGILEADTGSTVELWPLTASSSARRDAPGDPNREREYLASRDARVGYELWKRSETTAYGFYGDVGTLRIDRPFSEEIERRSQFQEPRIVAVLTGRMPYVQNNRMKYALRVGYEREDNGDEYRLFTTNPRGDYIAKDGVLVDPPEFFTPDETSVSSLIMGAAFSYRFGTLLDAAVGLDGISSRIEGQNAGPRYFSGTGQDRPYYVGQASITGGAGPFQYAVDGRGWQSSTEERWVFTLAGGIGQEPLSGRGKRLDRKEEGATLRSRARWRSGPLELGAGWSTNYRQIEIILPDPTDLSSFNYFRNTITYRQNADTLVLPDSVTANVAEERGYEAVVGGTWDINEGVVGVEYHMARQRLDQVVSGPGPIRKLWDVRAGFEHPLTANLDGRLGYIYRRDDRDDLTESNEFVGHTVSAGIGLVPAGSIWAFNLGYALEWITPDYPDPAESRESRQTLAMELRWWF